MRHLTLSQYLNQPYTLNPSGYTLYPSIYFNTTGNRTYEHIFAGGVPVATAETVGSGDPALSFNYQDHLNSTTLTTNNSGVITEILNYFPFGQLQYDEGTHTEQRKYTGHEYDASEYTYAGARYLGTSLGRFISQDRRFINSPEQYLEDPQQSNSYAYARNNPLLFVDPTGEIAMLFSRPVVWIGGHTFITIFPENPKIAPFTLGGYTNGLSVGDLFKAKNAESDYSYAFGSDKKGVSQIVISPPEGVSFEEFDQRILESYNSLPNVITEDSYGFMGQIRLTGNPNSNNVATDILLGAGVSKGAINNYQRQLFASNGKFTPGVGRSAFSPTFNQSTQNRLNATFAALGSTLTQLQATLFTYAYSLIPNSN